MSKGQSSKKNSKKEPMKTMKEKKLAKREKKYGTTVVGGMTELNSKII